jgi:AmmeMemoRadiSam system protein B
MDQTHRNASHVAERILKAERKTKRKVMLIASCDFSHFLTPSEGIKKDQLIIDHILERDAPGVEQIVIKNRLSVCGYGPIMSLMEFARLKDPEYKIEILARGHSGEVSPSQEVVDYISLIAFK